MTTPDPTEFDRLQQLPASKKKAQPEDGFFDQFSDKVLTRLEEPAPKPTLWERLNDQIDPLRAAAAVFAAIVGMGLLFALDEGSNLAEAEPKALGQADDEPAADPLDQAQNTLAGSGLPLNKDEAEPPRILMNPGVGLAPRATKVDPSFYRNKSATNTVHTHK